MVISAQGEADLRRNLEAARAQNLQALKEQHTFNERSLANPSGECLTCGDGHRGVPCVHSHRSRKLDKFIEKHIDEYASAFTNPDRSAASHVLERLEEERRNLPRGHICSEPGGCPSENKQRGIPACPVCLARWRAQAAAASDVCAACQKLPRQFRPKACVGCAALGDVEIGMEIGRTSPVSAPAPMTVMLDYFAGKM